jgi:hypothetical protein
MNFETQHHGNETPIFSQERNQVKEVLGKTKLLEKNQPTQIKSKVCSIRNFLAAREIEFSSITASLKKILSEEYEFRFSKTERIKPYQHRFEIKVNQNIFYLTAVLHNDGKVKIRRKAFGEEITFYVRKKPKAKRRFVKKLNSNF